MANGCVDVRMTREQFQEQTTEQKLTCIWDIVQPLQKDLASLKKWNTAKIFSGAMAGGALTILALILLGVRVMGK